VFDPWADPLQALREYDITLVQNLDKGAYDAIVIAVSHDQFKTMDAETIRSFGKSVHVLYDLKYILPVDDSDLRL
jgi:UDP-N-acetyl-D-galactosamine dehydrogenase